MSSDGASGADRSDNSSSDRSSGAERSVDKDTSDKARDTISGKSEKAAPEPTADDRAASQSKMEAEGQTAKDRVSRDTAAANQNAAPTPTDDPATQKAAPQTATATVEPAVAQAQQAMPTAQPAVANAATIPGVTLAQSATVPNTPAIPNAPTLPSPAQLGKGLRALSPAGAAFAASAGLQTLTDMAANAKVQAAADHLNVDLTTVEGISAANAYAKAEYMTETPLGAEAFRDITGLNVDPSKIGPNGAHRHAMLETIAQIEYDNPGSFIDPSVPPHEAWSNVGEVMGPQIEATLDAVDRGLTSGEKGALIGEGLAVERVSAVDPALSASSRNARAAILAAGGTLPQNWQAHHKVPFATVAALPVDVQTSIAASGWQMNDLGNLAALPADQNSYQSLPNNYTLPQHRGSHRNYSAMVAGMLAPVVAGHNTMAPGQLHTTMDGIGTAALGTTINPLGAPNPLHPFHPRLN
jgi:hypothetical protein